MRGAGFRSEFVGSLLLIILGCSLLQAQPLENSRPNVIVIITAYHEDMGIKIIIGVREALGNFNFY